MMSFKFDKQEGKEGAETLNYTAGQYAYFDMGGVNNDPKGPIRHFTISSSPIESFIMISTRIRDSIQTEAFITRRRSQSKGKRT